MRFQHFILDKSAQMTHARSWPADPKLLSLNRFSRLLGWARLGEVAPDAEQTAFETGAAFALLHMRVMADAPFARVWRRRLALKAATASARMARRGEHEEMLRDAFFLRTGSEDAGPAGRLLVGWRALDRSAPLDDESVLQVADILQLKKDDALRGAITGAEHEARSDRGAVFGAAETAKLVMALRPDAEMLAMWLADAVLAARLGWPQPVPLLADALLDQALRNSSLCIGGKRGRIPPPPTGSTAACSPMGAPQRKPVISSLSWRLNRRSCSPWRRSCARNEPML